MKKTLTILVVGLCALAEQTTVARAQDNDFQPEGKPIVTIFNQFGANYNRSEGVYNPAFALERAYLGYRYTFSPHWSSTIIFDAGRGEDNQLERIGFVKNAYAQYTLRGFTLQAGLLMTEQGSLTERYWGYRYVSKVFFDLNGWGNTADLGIKARYHFAKYFTLDAAILNGEGFKHLQADDQFLYAAGLTITPLQGLALRVYGDMLTTGDDRVNVAIGDSVYNQAAATQSNIAFFMGYDHRLFTIGAEYNLQLNHNNVEGHDLNGFSVFASVKLGDKIKLFARYDEGASTDSQNLWNYNNDGKRAIAGMEYRINQMISLAPAIRVSSHALSEREGRVYGFISTRISL